MMFVINSLLIAGIFRSLTFYRFSKLSVFSLNSLLKSCELSKFQEYLGQIYKAIRVVLHDQQLKSPRDCLTIKFYIILVANERS